MTVRTLRPLLWLLLASGCNTNADDKHDADDTPAATDSEVETDSVSGDTDDTTADSDAETDSDAPADSDTDIIPPSDTGDTDVDTDTDTGTPWDTGTCQPPLSAYQEPILSYTDQRDAILNNGCPNYTRYGTSTCITPAGTVYQRVWGFGAEVGSDFYYDQNGTLVAIYQYSDYNEFCGDLAYERWLGQIIVCTDTNFMQERCFDSGLNPVDSTESGDTPHSGLAHSGDSDTALDTDLPIDTTVDSDTGVDTGA